MFALAADAEKSDHKRTKQQEEASGDNEQPPGEVIHLSPRSEDYTDGREQEASERPRRDKHGVDWELAESGVKRCKYDDQNSDLTNALSKEFLCAAPIEHVDNAATTVPSGDDGFGNKTKAVCHSLHFRHSRIAVSALKGCPWLRISATRSARC